MPMPPLSRRTFLTTAALGLSHLAATQARAVDRGAETKQGEPSQAQIPPGETKDSVIIGFSKPFQKLSPQDTANFVADVGWDGIECPVRARGQVEPAKVDDQLPAYVNALAAKRLSIPLAATDITRVDQPDAERVLRALANVGTRRLRLGFQHYDLKRDISSQLREAKAALKDVAQACKDLGLRAGIQNHSGRDTIGAPVWDIVEIVREIDSPGLGLCFDIGHATIEGGLSWPIQSRLVEPWMHTLIVKDFLWQKRNQRWIEGWCHLGEGMVDSAYFDRFKTTPFAGPICQHHEYELGSLIEMKAAMQKDLAILRTWLA